MLNPMFEEEEEEEEEEENGDEAAVGEARADDRRVLIREGSRGPPPLPLHARSIDNDEGAAAAAAAARAAAGGMRNDMVIEEMEDPFAASEPRITDPWGERVPLGAVGPPPASSSSSAKSALMMGAARAKNIFRTNTEKLRIADRNRRFSVVKSIDVNSSFEAVRFNFARFLREFLMHITSPFSIPFIYFLSGWQYAKNQRWIGLGGVFYQWIPGLFFWLLIVLYFSSSAEDRAEMGLEVYMAMIMHTVHKLMVSTKYAYLNDDQIRQMHEHIIEEQSLSRLELVDGWNSPSPETSSIELQAAAARLGVNLSHVHFHLRSSKEEIRSFVRDPEYDPKKSDRAAGLLLVCAQGMSHRLVAMSNEIIDRRLRLGIFRNPFPFISFIQAFTPILLRVAYGDSPFGNSAQDGVLIVMSAMINMFYFGVLLRFIRVGVHDYMRRVLLMKMLQSLVDPDHVGTAQMSGPSSNRGTIWKKTSASAVDIPAVDLTIPENIVAWLVMRNLFQNFGLMYRKRVHLYSTYTFVFVMLLVQVDVEPDVVVARYPPPLPVRPAALATATTTTNVLQHEPHGQAGGQLVAHSAAIQPDALALGQRQVVHHAIQLVPFFHQLPLSLHLLARQLELAQHLAHAVNAHTEVQRAAHEAHTRQQLAEVESSIERLRRAAHRRR